jgi:dolichyl-phosphate beta-glucosyltransferase
MRDIVVVVPCYNEAARLPTDAFAAAVAADPSLSLLFVDDGSRDATASVLAGLAAQAPSQIEVLALEQNGGKAEAVRRGLLRAFERSPSLVAFLDADLATPLAELEGMRAQFADPARLMVFGSRVALLGREVVRSPVRHYLGRVYATAASLVLGLTVYDTQCGAKVFRNTPLVRSVFAQAFATRWTFDVEIFERLSALAKEGQIPPLERSAVEYPLGCWRDVAGSKLGPTDGLRAAVELGRLWLEYRNGWRR